MKKPCIIGTKNATKVLKDGDLVEVDAEKGIVKLISSNKEFKKKVNAIVLPPENWIDSFKWEYGAFPIYTSAYMGLYEKSDTPYFVYWPDFLTNFYEGKLIGYFPKKSILEMGHNVINELLESKPGFYEQVLIVDKELKEGIRVAEQILNKKGINSFPLNWPKLKKGISDSAYLLFSFDYTYDDFMKIFEKENPKDAELVRAHIVEETPSFMTIANEYLLNLKEKYANDLKKIHSEFVKEYSWFQNSYKGKFVITKKWLNNYLKDLKPVNKHIKEKRPLPKKYTLLVRTAIKIITLRDDKKKLLLLMVESMENWLKAIEKEKGYKKEVLSWLCVEEVFSVLDGNTELYKKAEEYFNNKRRVAIMGSTEYIDVNPNLYEDVAKLIVPKQSREIHGYIAQKGIVQGKAKVIIDPKTESTKFNYGDILVAPMTRPEYLPLMGQANAFVTDEGGVSCHVAIIAREMKKPCII